MRIMVATCWNMVGAQRPCSFNDPYFRRLECHAHNMEVTGSNPVGSTNNTYINMKSFIKQLVECIEDGTSVLMPTKETEVIHSLIHDGVEINNAYFCNKYMKRCSSKVCLKERELL